MQWNSFFHHSHFASGAQRRWRKAFRRLAGEETLFNYSPTLLDNICDAQRYRALVWQVGGRVKNKRQKFSQPPLAACCVVASF
jgi:hypothetical protein